MREEDVGDAMAIDARVQEIGKCPGTEVQQHGLVGTDQIAGGRPGRVNIRARAENGQPHV